MTARLSTTYRSNRRQVGAVVMLPRIVGENVDRLGHKYRIAGSPRWLVVKPPVNGARECARRRRQLGRSCRCGRPGVQGTEGERHVIRTAEPRPLAVEPETSDVADVEVGLSAESISPQPDHGGTRKRTPLTAEQKARKNEQERARRAAAKARKTVA